MLVFGILPYLNPYTKNQNMAALAAVATSVTVSSDQEFSDALISEAIQEIIIGAPFTIGHWQREIKIKRPLTIDGRNNAMRMTTGFTILSDNVTIKNMTIHVDPEENSCHVFDIEVVRPPFVFGEVAEPKCPKDIVIENCNIVGGWSGAIRKVPTRTITLEYPTPTHIAISMQKKTQVKVIDTTIQKCTTGIVVRDDAVCTLQRVTFKDNHTDKELMARPMMYGAAATPTGQINEENLAEYKQFVNE
jgi:hypothetical protein